MNYFVNGGDKKMAWFQKKAEVKLIDTDGKPTTVKVTGEVGQERGQGRPPWSLCHVPTGCQKMQSGQFLKRTTFLGLSEGGK
jgi:hypothetical protein